MQLSSVRCVCDCSCKIFRRLSFFSGIEYVKSFVFKLNLECWTRTPDVHGWFGTPHNFETLAECLAACVDDNTCLAVDWEPRNAAGQTCWTITLTVFSPSLDPGFITHYELDRTCLS